MIRKLLLLFIFSLQMMPLVASAATSPQTLYQVTAVGDAADFYVNIPPDLDPGFHSVSVVIGNSSNTAATRTLNFCKNLAGEIHWNNVCPDLTPVATQATLQAIKVRSELPKYNPTSEPKKTVSTIIIAFAALSVISVGTTSVTNKSPNQTQASVDALGSGYLSSLTAGALIALSATQLLDDEDAKPRNSRIRRIRDFPTTVAQKVSGFSPILGQIFSSGNYLRSMLSESAYVLYPLAIFTGLMASKSVNGEAMPPALGYIFALMALGSLDALAGLIAAMAFTIPVLLAGHLSSLDAGLTICGVGLLAFAPTLIAAAFRPLRRPVTNFTSLWERGSDYLLAAVLTSWIVRQMVQGLPGLAGVQLPLTASANAIALFAGSMILLRLLGEDISLRYFTKRNYAAEPVFRDQKSYQVFLSDLVKIGVFIVVAKPFIGFSPELWIGTTIFALPFVLDILDSKFPKSRWAFRFVPTGTVAIIFMATLGAIFAILIQAHISNPRTYILISFVLLSIPGLVLSILTSFGDGSHEQWRESKAGALFYRSTGTLVFISLVIMFIRGSLIQ